MSIRSLLKRFPFLERLATRVYVRYSTLRFRGSETYWDERYRRGMGSGPGSRDQLAVFKAEILNRFVAEHNIESVIDFGCGDGHQLDLAQYPSYRGYDVSETAVRCCQERFSNDPTKTFALSEGYDGVQADLALSLDVIYHLVEDEVFNSYMQQLFDAASKYVAIYSSNTDEQLASQGAHVRHRRFSDWVEDRHPEWLLIEHVPNRYPFDGDPASSSFADFFIYSRVTKQQ